MEKLIKPIKAISYIKNGDSILVGGFGVSGTPLTILDEIASSDLKDLTAVSNNLGEKGKGLGKLLDAGNLKKAVGSYFTTGRHAVEAWLEGRLEIELVPQGTLAEALRCGGAGIGGFYTKTSVGTKLAENKEKKVIDGEEYVFEKAIKGDVALIKASRSDTLGNLTYDKTALNFNHVMATAGKTVIVEVDEIVEAGEIEPQDIITPHLYVDYIVENKYIKKGGEYIEPSNSAENSKKGVGTIG
ncbi:3-oxoacid CoA-transferase subunit A [Thalassobacillus cyri]|uniref:3-oxoacid CoA-transferase subunit A n=1 Tax=Thalassobacillus cyri TaxID=571932 RepID=A0A1H4A9V0_9BACI|nr:CoA transferase subunit A [Thalassobacillus cyri]SEA32558.1 3-oxoacid CoA-transferase subunit A [Thalassobacillus cyri]